MALEIREIKDKNEWENFMSAVRPSSFLHSWAWGKFNDAIGSRVFYLGVYDRNELAAAALILLIAAKRGSFLFCPHGPIIRSEEKKKDVINALREYLMSLAKLERCAFIRISPLLGNNPGNEKLFTDLGFKQAPVHMMHPELSWILDITPTEADLLMAMRKTTRYCIRKAEKDGVETAVSSSPDDVEIFWDIYRATVDRQNFTPFSKNYLHSEFEIFNKDDGVRLFFAKYNNEVVAAAFIVFYGGFAFYHHGASIHKYPKITAPYLLQWAVIREAKKRGCKFYNFWGVVPEEMRKHPWAGLSLFKRGFGGSSCEYVHAKDLVVTSKYWLNYLVETVRKKKRGL